MPFSVHASLLALASLGAVTLQLALPLLPLPLPCVGPLRFPAVMKLHLALLKVSLPLAMLEAGEAFHGRNGQQVLFQP